jgi:hypothetical protein
MIDTPSTFELQRLQAACARDPLAFARVTRLIALAAVTGFALIFLAALTVFLHALVALVMGAAAGLLIGVKLLLGGYLTWSGLLALRPSTQAVPGQKLTPQDVPTLFHLLDRVAKKVGVALPESVVLDGQAKTQVLWHARLGALGGHQHTLVLGLPALLALDIQQFGAIVGRELARLGGTGDHWGAWLQGMRRTWARLAQSLSMAAIPVRHSAVGYFLRYVFPWFNARALVLARHQSYAADHVMCCLGGSYSAMHAMVRLEVQEQYLAQSFWPEVLARASHAPTPHVFPFRAMAKRVCAVHTHPKASQWLTMSLQKSWRPEDVEACLHDRLARIKWPAKLSPAPEQSAAELLLCEAFHPVLEQMDSAWQRDIAPRWTRLHQEYLTQFHLEKELQAQGEQGSLHADDHLLWAQAARHVQGNEAYQALLSLMLIDHPDDPHARYELGCLLLEQTHTDACTQGAELLRKLAFEQTSCQSLAAAQRYGQWLELQGKSDEAAFWADEVRRLAHLEQEAHTVCKDFSPRQRFTAPDLSPRHLHRMRKALAHHPEFEQAHLVSKPVDEFSGWRFAVLLLDSSAHTPGVTQAILASITALNLPVLLTVVDASAPAWLSVPRKAIAAQIRATAGAVVFGGPVNRPPRELANPDASMTLIGDGFHTHRN